jgi:hypothetical protein
VARKPFKTEYLLGKGYPLFILSNSGGKRTGYQAVSMATTWTRFDVAIFKVPEELFYEQMPKFELILRRIDEAEVSSENQSGVLSAEGVAPPERDPIRDSGSNLS